MTPNNSEATAAGSQVRISPWIILLPCSELSRRACSRWQCSAPAAAQGRVTGTVKDADGHAIKGATIVAANPAGVPSSSTATSDAKGHFGFLGLRGTGTWTFKVEAPGFVPGAISSSIRVLGQNPSMDFSLQRAPQLSPLGPMASVDEVALEQQLAAAAALAASDRLDEAIAAYREVLTRIPALSAVHLEVAALLERKQDTAGAIAEYQAALKGDPGNERARGALDRLARL